MATVMLGARMIALYRSDDLDARVLALTGLSPAELARMLRTPSPSLVAVAIIALADDGDLPSRAEIGALVTASELAEVTAVLRSLLDPAPQANADHPVATMADEETAHAGE